mmetsp:Transcript_38643/g.152594  ORF Transcript_38643/g.152594 Transcript_38643/m.152594 type:complete len:104 (+) Transcript_38643:3490-3801(+)
MMTSVDPRKNPPSVLDAKTLVPPNDTAQAEALVQVLFDPRQPPSFGFRAGIPAQPDSPRKSVHASLTARWIPTWIQTILSESILPNGFGLITGSSLDRRAQVL